MDKIFVFVIVIGILMEESEEQTFDDFKKMMESSFPASTLGMIADKYDEIVPKSVQLLANLDPTGIASTINQYLTENKAKREQENILYAIYLCLRSIQNMKRNYVALREDMLNNKVPNS